MLLWVYAHNQSKHGLAGCQEFFEYMHKIDVSIKIFVTIHGGTTADVLLINEL